MSKFPKPITKKAQTKINQSDSDEESVDEIVDEKINETKKKKTKKSLKKKTKEMTDRYKESLEHNDIKDTITDQIQTSFDNFLMYELANLIYNDYRYQDIDKHTAIAYAVEMLNDDKLKKQAVEEFRGKFYNTRIKEFHDHYINKIQDLVVDIDDYGNVKNVQFNLVKKPKIDLSKIKPSIKDLKGLINKHHIINPEYTKYTDAIERGVELSDLLEKTTDENQRKRIQSELDKLAKIVNKGEPIKIIQDFAYNVDTENDQKFIIIRDAKNDNSNAYFKATPEQQKRLLAYYEGWEIPDKKSYLGAKKFSNKISQVDLPINLNLTKKQIANQQYKIRRSNK